MFLSAPIRGVEEESKPAGICTFAVLDLETTNLPAYNNNRVGITELCIYAFDPATLKDNNEIEKSALPDGLSRPPPNLPSPPRILHKLNLLFQPSMMIHPGAETITGLNNYILERESRLNVNAAQMILKFFDHLPAPVCLIAHNGWNFDFPIFKQAFVKLNLQLPGSMRCVDSLRAFMEIDDKRADIIQNVCKHTDLVLEIKQKPELKMSVSTQTEAVIDWQAVNETTPKRATLPSSEKCLKRKLLTDSNEDANDSAMCPANKLKSRRQLFKGLKCATKKRIPPRGQYGLASLFERTFKIPAAYAHQAEADVIMLTKLIQHYGVDFAAFAEEEAILFADVVPLGEKQSY